MPNGAWDRRTLDCPVRAEESRARLEREAAERTERDRARIMARLAERPDLWPTWLMLHPEDRPLAPSSAA
jgi:hypothetical protein